MALYKSLTYLLNKSDWRPTAAVIPTYCVLEFNMNRRIRNKSHEEAKIRDILRPGKAQAGTRDTEAEIRDVPGNTGRLASLVFGAYKIWHTLALLATPLTLAIRISRLRTVKYGISIKYGIPYHWLCPAVNPLIYLFLCHLSNNSKTNTSLKGHWLVLVSGYVCYRLTI